MTFENFTCVIKAIFSLVETESFIDKHRTSKQYFTRGTAKLSMQKLMFLILSKSKSSLHAELRQFFKKINHIEDVESDKVTKGCFSLARQKVNESSFIELKDELLYRCMAVKVHIIPERFIICLDMQTDL